MWVGGWVGLGWLWVCISVLRALDVGDDFLVD